MHISTLRQRVVSSALLPLLFVILQMCVPVISPAEACASTATAELIGWQWSGSQWMPLPGSGGRTGVKGLEEFTAGVQKEGGESKLYLWGMYRTFGPKEADITFKRFGAIYNIDKKTWEPFPLEGAPEARSGALMFWVGPRFYVWGGKQFQNEVPKYVNSGAYFDVRTNRWSPMSQERSPLLLWARMTVVKNTMVVWGPKSEPTVEPESVGGVYNFDTDRWQEMNTAGAPDVRYTNAFIPLANTVLAWGGETSVGCIASGGYYDPQQNLWTPMKPTRSPDSCRNYILSWSGERMLVWGGQISLYDKATDQNRWSYVNSGGVFNPESGAWEVMSVDGAPLFTEETNAGTDRRVLWADNKLFVYRVVTHNDECSWEGSFWDAKTNRWSVVKNAFSPRSEGGFRTVWSEGGTPTTLQLYSVNLNLASGTLYGCKKFSMVQRADSEYSGDQLVYAGDQIFLFSNKLPLVPPSTEAR